MTDAPENSKVPGDGSHQDVSPSIPYSVDVAAAKEEFNALSRQLSQRSEILPSGATTRAASDVEKGDSEEAPFDLREYLSSSNDAQQQAGIKHKVAGGVNSKIYAGTLGQACLNFFLAIPLYIWGQFFAPLLNKTEGPTRTILHKQSGMLKSGEMCLVLGCPGSGCTTFLKAIANDRDTFGSVLGEVLYQGIDAETMQKYYKGEVVFNQEGDVHIATPPSHKLWLSHYRPKLLAQTDVSLACRERNLTQKFKICFFACSIFRTPNKPSLETSVSGGERKRVSIAEMMATRARAQAWDNSTRGLDASTALDFAKSLRIMTDILVRRLCDAVPSWR
ncbi:hypothetical protein B0H14DRAFT_3167681, partial [Mycena olivaceomarginata]